MDGSLNGGVTAGDSDTCAGGVWNRISVIAYKTTGEATVVTNFIWKYGDGKMAFIETLCVWVIVVSGGWIVVSGSVRLVIVANGNAI